MSRLDFITVAEIFFLSDYDAFLPSKSKKNIPLVCTCFHVSKRHCSHQHMNDTHRLRISNIVAVKHPSFNECMYFLPWLHMKKKIKSISLQLKRSFRGHIRIIKSCYFYENHFNYSSYYWSKL